MFTSLLPLEMDRHLPFIDRRGGLTDSSVYKIMDRHPLWTDAAVVMDWSDEMYLESAQAVLWHKTHPKTSNIDYFVFTNDGDKLSDRKKRIGKTGGVYFVKSNNFRQVERRLDYVAKRGNGGDDNSNNLFETTLLSIQKYDDVKDFVVVADNESCTRDFRLIKFLDTPVKVILTNVKGPINPQYINMAYKSGGSLHTSEDDYYNYVFKGLADSNQKLILNGVSYVLNEEGFFDFEDTNLRMKKGCKVSAKGSLFNFGF
jgi:hypothetical protein